VGKAVRIVSLDLNDDEVISVVVEVLKRTATRPWKAEAVANSILAALRRYAERELDDRSV
jgi:hypothetical protein